MIIFDLSCEQEHRFEGWFQNAAAFEQQQKDGLIACPQCNSPRVRRIPSAVLIAGQKSSVDSEPAVSAANGEEIIAPSSRTQAMALYRQLTQVMEALSEDVGTSFAEEARRMHYQEIPERPIRGRTSDDEFSALQEEGIAVLRLPKIREEDLN